MSEDACRELADAIILQAAYDWRRLCKKGAHGGAFAELRGFFRSQWCAALCGDADPIMILGRLEEERKLANLKK